MTKHLKWICSLLLIIMIGTSCQGLAGNKKTNSLASNHEEGPVELEFTKQELKEMGKWKNKPFESLVADACEGDRAALYMIGMTYLTGIGGLTIDVKEANRYFAASASLGYAPSIDKIKSMYIYDINNPCLALVYANLVASSGHREFILPYHRLRDKFTTELGSSFAVEVEKIAARKQEAIYQNIKDLKAAKDKHLFVAYLLAGQGLTAEDKSLGWDHWLKHSKIDED